MKKSIDLNDHYKVEDHVFDYQNNRHGTVKSVFKNSLLVKYEHSTVRYTKVKMPEFLDTIVN